MVFIYCLLHIKNRLEELIIKNLAVKEIEKYLSDVEFVYAHQSMKILMDVFYEHTSVEYGYEWKNILENMFVQMPTEKDCKTFEDVLINIAIYLAAIQCSTEEERINDANTQKELEDFFLNEMNMKKLNPLLDKLLAFSLKLFLNEYSDFSDVEKNAERLAEKFKIVLNVSNDIMQSKKELSIYKDDLENLSGIDTSALEIGMVVKNYRELCMLLNQDVKGGKSKQLQIEDFKRYFDFEKAGQKFIITDIYDEPLTKEDKRKLGNNSIYVKYIEMILLQHLSKQKGYTKTLTKRNWWELLGMVNKKYNKIAPKQLQKIDYKITPFQINNFYQRCNKKLEQILFSALNNLKNRKLILWELQTVIVTIDDRGKQDWSLALDEDKKRILQVERYILKNVMRYEKIFQVFLHNKQNEYYHLVNEKLNELYGWHHYFKQIKLIYTPEDVQEAIQQSEIELQKEILNQKIINVLNDNAKEKFNKETERWEKTRNNLMIWGDYQENNQLRKWLPDTYLEAQRILTEELINIGHKEQKFTWDCFEEDDELNQIFNSFMC